MTEVTFTSHGVPCAAWHLPAADDTLSAQAGRPCVVMAHGFGGTRDTGLLAYAEAFARAGIDALEAGLNRPTTSARRLTCPILVQVGDRDTVAPPAAARRTARKAGPLAQLREYPVDHFDVYQGRWQQTALADQLGFLSRTLAPLPATQPLTA